jgi:hypothetical protein
VQVGLDISGILRAEKVTGKHIARMWEGEPEIGRARRPAVFPEASTMVKLPVRGTRIPNPSRLKKAGCKP